MAIRIGLKNLTSTQMDLLEASKSPTIPTPILGSNLLRVFSDSEIQKGIEDMHPDWVTLFETNKENLQKSFPTTEFEQLDKAYSLLKPLDKALFDMDPTKGAVSFLLGAGASKPEPSGIPTVKELLPDLLTRARRLDRDEVTKLANFCDETKIDNIEDLLTAAQLSDFCSRNPKVLSLVDFLLFSQETLQDIRRERHYTFPRGLERVTAHRSPVGVSTVAFLQDTLQVLFGLLSSRMLPADPNPTHSAIAKFVCEQPNTTIVTCNYDCCMDRELSNGKVPFSYMLDFGNIHEPRPEKPECTQLIKLHGSLNWFYCETCQKTQLIDIERTVADYKSDTASYPVIAVCKDCGGQRRGLVVPPLAMKFEIAPPLNPLLDRAGDAFSRSDLIIVVGFSFADADLYISRMLSKAMQNSQTTNLIVIDPDPDVAIRVRRKFSIRIPNFDEKRIIAARGDCAEILPKFLRKQLQPSSTASKKANTPDKSPRKAN